MAYSLLVLNFHPHHKIYRQKGNYCAVIVFWRFSGCGVNVPVWLQLLVEVIFMSYNKSRKICYYCVLPSS